MISSAVLRATALIRTGAAEVPSSTKPRPVQQHRGGASKTAHSHIPMKEATTYGHQGTRPRHEDHHDHPARREDHHDHPRRQPMTAATVSGRALWNELWDALDQFVADAVTSAVPAQIVRAMQSPDAHVVDITIDGVPATVPIQAGRLTPNEVVSAWQDLRASVVALDLEAVS